MVKLVAQKSDRVFLLSVGEDMARVLDLDQGKLFPPFNVQSILARGYWENPVIELNEVIPLMEGVRFIDAVREQGEVKCVQAINRQSGMTILDIIAFHNHIRIVQHFDRALFEWLLRTSKEEQAVVCEEMEHWAELVPKVVNQAGKAYAEIDGRDYMEALVAAQPSVFVQFQFAN